MTGNTEFMKEHNSYLIPVAGLEPVLQGAFQVQFFLTKKYFYILNTKP
jgi:hypothetical protein